jgi:hypothetical protein
LLPRVRAMTPPWWVGAVPLVAYAGWRTWVRARWADVVPHPPGDSPLTAPFVELGRYVGRAAGAPGAEADNLLLLLPTLAVLVLLALALTRAPEGTAHLRLALAAYLVLLACLPVWDRSQAYLGWLLLLQRRAARRVLPALPALAGLVAATWLVAVALTFAYPGPDHWLPADERTDPS